MKLYLWNINALSVTVIHVRVPTYSYIIVQMIVHWIIKKKKGQNTLDKSVVNT